MITLFKRLPSLFWRPKVGEQIVQPTDQSKYPTLQADFGVLEKQLLDDFRRLDNEALGAQNQFRLLQIFLIGGAVATTTLGAFQAALPGKGWPIAEAVVAGLLTVVAAAAKQLDSQKKYFSNRLKAEMLRGEYFLFLGRVGTYNDDTTRMQNLVRRVTDIQAEQKGD